MTSRSDIQAEQTVPAACGRTPFNRPHILGRELDYIRSAVGGMHTERLVGLCRTLGAEFNVSGPSARAYLDDWGFAEHGIEVAYIDYSGYAEHPQLHPPFEHHVTVLDLLFRLDPSSASYLTEAHT